MRYNYEYKGLIALVEVLSERRNPSAFGNIFFAVLRGHRPRSYTHEPTSKVRSHDAAHTIASLTLFLKHTASPSKYATHSSLS